MRCAQRHQTAHFVGGATATFTLAIGSLPGAVGEHGARKPTTGRVADEQNPLAAALRVRLVHGVAKPLHEPVVGWTGRRRERPPDDREDEAEDNSYPLDALHGQNSYVGEASTLQSSAKPGLLRLAERSHIVYVGVPEAWDDDDG